MGPYESLHRRPRGGSATLAILVAVALGLGLAGELAAQIIVNGRVAAGPGPANPPEPKDDQQVLSGAGINADAESIAAYLRKLKPSQATAEEIQKLVAQLGSEVWKEREEASARLTALGSIAAEALAAAAKSTDAEVRIRAEKILKELSQSNVLESALAVAAQKKMALPAGDLLGVEGLCQESRPRRLLERLLETSATPKDLPGIRAALKSSSEAFRPCLLGALAKAAGDQAGQELLAAGGEQEKILALPAAHALIDRSDPRCLTLLTQLLKGQDNTLRRQAAVLLQDLADKDFGLLKDSPPDEQKKSQADAIAWTEGAGKTAKLLFEQAHPKQWGRILVCLAEANELAEFDDQGKKTWSVKMDDPWACQGLPNGHRLAGSVKGRKAIEFDEDGKEVWKVEDLPGACNCLLRLRNGNTLVGCREAKKFIEFDPQGKIAKEIPLPGEPFLIQRLDNGLLLVLLKDTETIVEMDQTGKIGWKLGPLDDVMSLQRLPNGNTLVALSETAKIIEYDRSGKSVWEYMDLSPDMSVRGPKGTQRLEDGTTLIGDMFSLNRVDKDGKMLRRINCGYVTAVHSY
jgi:hypothetical protein